MIFRNLDSNGDWTFGKGKNDYLSKNDAILLNVKTRLLSWTNDCFFDMFAGIDWYTKLGFKNQNDLLEADIRQIILESQDVTGITDIDINFDYTERKFEVSYTINTIYTQEYENKIEVSI